MPKPLIAVAASVMFWMTSRSPPAEAKMASDAGRAPTYSLRPGMSADDIKDVLSGKSDIRDHDPARVASLTPASKPRESTSKSIYGEGYDDEDDFHLDVDEEEANASGKAATKADQQRATSMQASQSSQFSGFQKKKSTMMYVKVGTGLFIPTFGTMFAREHFRSRREEAYVQKGLEILEAQKAEYFNVTSTSEDSDLEDELKGIKNNSTDGDADDEDNDGEDDDDGNGDDDETGDDDRPRRGPHRPTGPSGNPNGGNDSGGSGFDPGYGKASDEDRDRLKNLFDKS